MGIDYNKIIKEKAIIVWYLMGMRGNSVYRILAAHPEVYWNAKFETASHEMLEHPLDLPETVSGFNAMYSAKGPNEERGPLYKKGFTKGIPYLKFGYSTYHAAGHMGGPITNWSIHNSLTKLVNTWITSKSYLDKKLFLMRHPTEDNSLYIKNPYPADSLLTLDSSPHIWIYGTIDRFNRNKMYHEPSPNPLAYNLNLDALFSTDYITFETEYYKLINRFNLTSCINRVRAFILLSLERDKYISKFY